jgi:hypothetical protein
MTACRASASSRASNTRTNLAGIYLLYAGRVSKLHVNNYVEVQSPNRRRHHQPAKKVRLLLGRQPARDTTSRDSPVVRPSPASEESSTALGTTTETEDLRCHERHKRNRDDVRGMCKQNNPPRNLDPMHIYDEGERHDDRS